MESIHKPRTIKTSIITRSTRKLETIRLEMNTRLNMYGATMSLICDDTYSPIEMCLSVNSQSDSFRHMARLSMGVTHEKAALLIRNARQEQRYGGDNVENNPTYFTGLSIAPLVLAHSSPKINFSLSNLQPHTIDNLKLLALDHESSAVHLQMD